MKHRYRPIAGMGMLAWAILNAPATVQGIQGEPVSTENVVHIRIETSAGPIEAELYPDRAPITVENFLRYLDAGLYDGGQFFRTVREDNQPDDSVRIAVIQGTMSRARRSESFPAIPLERTSVTGVSHVDGTLSMARAGPDTAVADFFVCIGDQPELDYGGARNTDGQGFAAFGRVTSGMEAVRRIQRGEARGQRLLEPVLISRMVRVEER